ncbi:hypothetical protein BGZ99_004357 [Dissophora globulifera]|uniref:Uncharacterized protein n=1 Tax=Dissophora globulifera TaxID=979702 RepID=A0A9P6UV64_9FUNG|nr:hypothetical protein BGZ99_004357 [Dissophora globulifera]
MKIFIPTLAVLLFLTVVTAAPATPAAPCDGDSCDNSGDAQCKVHGFKPDWGRISECCLSNMGGSEFDARARVLECSLPIGDVGFFWQCVQELHFATTVECEFDQDDDDDS